MINLGVDFAVHQKVDSAFSIAAMNAVISSANNTHFALPAFPDRIDDYVSNPTVPQKLNINIWIQIVFYLQIKNKTPNIFNLIYDIFS